jgi:NAD(P)-dependent dehydrogenase (short-subunit alcohol dehydrogenase family)
LTYAHDVTCYEAIPALFQQICRDLGGLDLFIYSAGFLPRVAEDEYNFEKDRIALEVNLLGAVAWLNQAADRFGRGDAGTIVGISSVAGDRGRRGNPVYNASKAGLDTYLEALRMRLGPKGVTVLTAKPGSVSTPMTEGLGKLPLMIHPQEAASRILEAAREKRSVAYIPSKWRPIMFIIRNLPARLVPK